MRLQGCADHTLPGKWDPDDPEMEQETIWGLDLGSGVWISPFAAKYATADEHAGGIVWHVHPDGQLCGGAVNLIADPDHPERPVWTVESWDPLTISPSVRACSGPDGAECLHGFIRNGRWEGC